MLETMRKKTYHVLREALKWRAGSCFAVGFGVGPERYAGADETFARSGPFVDSKKGSLAYQEPLSHTSGTGFFPVYEVSQSLGSSSLVDAGMSEWTSR